MNIFVICSIIILSNLCYIHKKSYIPKKIHQTYSSFDEIPVCVKNVIFHNISINPNYTYSFYDDNDIVEYIKTHESNRVFKAFKLIRNEIGAAKADFFRYIILYHEGGVYADIKSKFVIPLDQWIFQNKLHITFWPWHDHSYLKHFYKKSILKEKTSNNYEINQAILIYPRGHPILRKTIDAIVLKIENDFKHNKPSEILGTTGPHKYTKIVTKEIPTFDYKLYDNNTQLYDGNVLYDGTDGCYHNSETKKKVYYRDLLKKNKSILINKFNKI